MLELEKLDGLYQDYTLSDWLSRLWKERKKGDRAVLLGMTCCGLLPCFKEIEGNYICPVCNEEYTVEEVMKSHGFPMKLISGESEADERLIENKVRRRT